MEEPRLPTVRSTRKPMRPISRPWTATEIRVCRLAAAALKSARACAALGERRQAIRYCLGGLCVTAGFPRPFAVRDEIVDFMRHVDPDGIIRKAFVIASLDATEKLLAE